jgi:hypothetical protein
MLLAALLSSYFAAVFFSPTLKKPRGTQHIVWLRGCPLISTKVFSPTFKGTLGQTQSVLAARFMSDFKWRRF